jgi:uncharacterized protein (DUF2236 family)
MARDDDDGYFPRGRSVLRRVHSERAVGLLYGQRALMIGALNPLNFVGTMEHTKAKLEPFQRLTHTAKAFERIFFGNRAQADEVLERVRRLHERVKGELPEDAGVTPAGTPYSADDPALMLWTVAVIADSAQVFYEMLVRRLDDAELDALWLDYVRFGELFGMSRSDAPETYREFRAYWDELLAGEELYLTEDARYIGYATAFEIPVPGIYAPARRVHDLLMLGSLPRRVRDEYDLAWTPAHSGAFRVAVAAFRRSRPFVPRAVRRGQNTDAFAMVARTERRRLAHGEHTPQVPA